MSAWQALASWTMYDTWLTITAALAAVACALPGNLLLLRRQSMLGDALSHAVLPGIVLGYLAMNALASAAGLSHLQAAAWRTPALLAGAALSGLVCAVLSELVRTWGRLEPSAALGVVYTSLFALGLLLIRLAADTVDLDPGCVLYGNLELAVIDLWPGTDWPRAAVTAGIVIGVELVLLGLFYKEILLATFDEAQARVLGVPLQRIRLGVLLVTATAVVCTFEAVGSILVIAMLVLPAAMARLCTDRFAIMIGLSVVFAIASGVLGQLLALTAPSFLPDAWTQGAVDAGSAGSIAVAGSLLLLATWLLAPRYGLVRRYTNRWGLRQRILQEDLLGRLFRESEHPAADSDVFPPLPARFPIGGPLGRWRQLEQRFARRSLQRRGWVSSETGGLALTAAGREQAQRLVRSHRLWETFLARNFLLHDETLHSSAEHVEHYLGPELQEQLARELDEPTTDPHGSSIPPA